MKEKMIDPSDIPADGLGEDTPDFEIEEACDPPSEPYDDDKEYDNWPSKNWGDTPSDDADDDMEYDDGPDQDWTGGDWDDCDESEESTDKDHIPIVSKDEPYDGEVHIVTEDDTFGNNCKDYDEHGDQEYPDYDPNPTRDEDDSDDAEWEVLEGSEECSEEYEVEESHDGDVVIIQPKSIDTPDYEPDLPDQYPQNDDVINSDEDQDFNYPDPPSYSMQGYDEDQDNTQPDPPHGLEDEGEEDVDLPPRWRSLIIKREALSVKMSGEDGTPYDNTNTPADMPEGEVMQDEDDRSEWGEDDVLQCSDEWEIEQEYPDPSDDSGLEGKLVCVDEDNQDDPWDDNDPEGY